MAMASNNGITTMEWEQYDQAQTTTMSRPRRHDDDSIKTDAWQQLSEDDAMTTMAWQQRPNHDWIRQRDYVRMTKKERREWNDNSGMTITV